MNFSRFHNTLLTSLILGGFLIAFGIASHNTDQHWLAQHYLAGLDMEPTDKSRFADLWASKSSIFLFYKYAFQPALGLLLDLALYCGSILVIGKICYRETKSSDWVRAGLVANAHYLLAFLFAIVSVYNKSNLIPLQVYYPLNLSYFAAHLGLHEPQQLWSQLTPLSSVLSVPLLIWGIKQAQGKYSFNNFLFAFSIFCAVQLLKFEFIFPLLNETF